MSTTKIQTETTTETSTTADPHGVKSLEAAVARAVEMRNAELSRVHQLDAKGFGWALEQAGEHAARAESMRLALVGLRLLLDEAREEEAGAMNEPAYHAELAAERR